MSISDALLSRIMKASLKELKDPKSVRTMLPGAGTSDANAYAVQVLQVREMVENMKASESARKFTLAITVCTVVIAITSIANVWIAFFSRGATP